MLAFETQSGWPLINDTSAGRSLRVSDPYIFWSSRSEYYVALYVECWLLLDENTTNLDLNIVMLTSWDSLS